METEEEQEKRMEKERAEAKVNRKWFRYFKDSEIDWNELSAAEIGRKQKKFQQMKKELIEVYDFLKKKNLSFEKKEREYSSFHWPSICNDCQHKLASYSVLD